MCVNNDRYVLFDQSRIAWYTSHMTIQMYSYFIIIMYEIYKCCVWNENENE